MQANPSNEPLVYKAVRAVGVLKPKFQPKAGTVFADSLDVRGTGFWLRDKMIMITCAHVVQDIAITPIEIGGLLVVGNRGNYARARVDAIDFAHDLAVLRLEIQPEQLKQDAADGLLIASAYPQVGASVGYAGFPLGTQLLNSTHAPTYSEGVVGAQLRPESNRKQIQITGSVVGGFSGAPIVAKDNPDSIVAVLSSSPSKDAGSANIFMAISWEHVRAIAELATS